MRRWALALATLGLAACSMYGSLGDWVQLGAGTTGAPSGSGGASGTPGAGGTGGAGTGGAAPVLCTPSTLGTGAAVWSKGYGDPSGASASGIAVDATGNVIVAGNFQGSVDFGCGKLPSVGGANLFVAKLDPGGACLWSKGFRASVSNVGTSVAVDASGSVLVTGSFNGSSVFGSTTLTSVGGENVFVAKLDPGGAPTWSERFGNGQSQGVSVAVDAASNVLVMGFFQGSIDFGGSSSPIVGGMNDALFVAKLDPSGASLWSKGFANVGGDAVTVDASRNVIVTGVFAGAVDLGGCTLTSMGASNGFVAKLDPSGACLWAKGFGPAGPTSVAVDAAGAILITGGFAGSVSFGGATFTSVGSENLFVAKFDSSGAHAWSKGFPGGASVGLGIAADATSNVFVTGGLDGSTDLGGGTLTSAGGQDVVLASFDAGGNHRWAKRFGNPQQQVGLSIAVDSSCHVLIAGTFEGTFDFGGNPLVSAGGDDAFVAEFVR